MGGGEQGEGYGFDAFNVLITLTGLDAMHAGDLKGLLAVSESQTFSKLSKVKVHRVFKVLSVS